MSPDTAQTGGVERAAFRAAILHLLDDPGDPPDAAAVAFWADGLLLVRDGHVEQVGAAGELLPRLPAGVPVTEYPGCLIVPGLIDTHIHCPQTDVIASHGAGLLEWLERYTFPAEERFADGAHAREVADFFVAELLRNGTTTALVLGTVHKHSADAIFEAARARHMRLLAGKVMMDRNCPAALRDTAASSYADSRALIETWHGKERLLYAVTPRFAPTSSPAQLTQAGRLLAEFPGVYLHTHLAESRAEVAWVAELFPGSRSYLDVYDRHGLVRPRAVFAHGIHLDAADRRRLAEAGAAIAFCPTSNLFLGSGLFDLAQACGAGVRVGVGTDVGGGTSFSMLRTLSEAYKVAQLAGHTLSGYRALYLATLGAARALYLEDRIGNFTAGKEADFVVLDLEATLLMRRRTRAARHLEEKLFVVLTLGDDRSVAATFILGQAAYVR